MTGERPAVSIVVPCYNQGQFIQDAIESIEKCKRDLYELIVVNDGSTDQHTQQVLTQLANAGYTVLNKPNGGLGDARNAGIAIARGQYVLPLDSDDKLRADTVLPCIQILDSKPSVGVVYGDAQCFGESKRRMRARDMFFPQLLAAPPLYYCSMYRREIWETLHGYDTKMPMQGSEDWEFWIRVARGGWEFHRIAQVVFDYRIRPGSMVETVAKNRKTIMAYIVRKHADVYAQQYLAYADATNSALFFRKWPAEFLARFFSGAFAPNLKMLYKRLNSTRPWNENEHTKI